MIMIIYYSFLMLMFHALFYHDDVIVEFSINTIKIKILETEIYRYIFFNQDK